MQNTQRKMNTLISFSAPLTYFEKLKKYGNVYFLKNLSSKQKLQILPNIDALIVFKWHSELTDTDLKTMTRLKIIQTLLAGVDNLPLSQLRDKVILKNSGASSDVIAEHVFAMILAKTRNIIYHNNTMRAGKFEQLRPAITLQNKIIGIVGYGSIGKHIAKIARTFNMKIWAISRHNEKDCDFIGTLQDLDYVLKNADIVVLAIPLTKLTRNLITMEKLQLMKKTAILVNVARGKLINERDLYEYLQQHPDFSACLDVWWHYNRSGSFKQHYPFERLPNVIMTPHTASVYEQYFTRMVKSAVLNLSLYLENKPKNVVKIEDYI